MRERLRAFFRSLGIDVHRYYGNANGGHPSDFTREEADTWQKVRKYTQNGPEQIIYVKRACEWVLEQGIPGAFVECGVWRGGTAMVMNGRPVYLYDTYRGMSQPGPHDGLVSGHRPEAWGALPKRGEYPAITSDAVLERVPNGVVIEGDVLDTIPAHLPEQIAVLHLDTDFYETTLHELKHLWPLVSPGGIAIIDDYYLWTGVKNAVDEFFPSAYLHRVDEKAVAVQK